MLMLLLVSASSQKASIENRPATIKLIAANASNSALASVKMALSSQINLSVLNYAFKGYEAFANTVRPDRMIIVDFSLPSTTERFFVINPKTGELLYKKLVAHGQGTGQLYAQHFSNKNESHQSSLGFFKTAETYIGKHGFSLRLDGLQKGLNSAARERAIVMHAADYVSEDFIKQNGYLGRSWGCPALPKEDFEAIVNEVENGTLLLIYHPNLAASGGKI